MPYKNNIPLSTDKTKQSVSDIQRNYQFYYEAFSVNHVAIDAVNFGKHKFIHFPEQGGDPSTAADEGALYTKVGTTSGETELFFRRESNGSSIAGTEGDGATLGWSRLFSGMMMKWGSFTVPALTTNGTHNFTQGPAFSNIYEVFATIEPTGGASISAQLNTIVSIPTGTIGSFDWRIWKRSTANSAGSGGFIIIRYLAIGS
ncbi:MAG: hypothetical protein R3230_01450 [Nitrosopumilaceae archaeon]|nr:hypothetical protein [Nitrosopumilaceae archaeon]